MDITTFFDHPSWWGIGLAIIFGAVWLAPLAPCQWRTRWLWLLLVGGALLFAPVMAWIQVPLQEWAQEGLIGLLGAYTFQVQILLVVIPLYLISGLVQEGAKLVPTVIYWGVKGRNIDPKLGLCAGAIVGAGFAIIEAQWVLNAILVSGWVWEWVGMFGVIALSGFWERFFTVAFHIASGALAGWGLARGWGWQFYLLVSGVHFLINYTVILVTEELLTLMQVEIILAVGAVVLYGVVLWLRWRRTAELEAAPVIAAEIPDEESAWYSR